MVKNKSTGLVAAVGVALGVSSLTMGSVVFEPEQYEISERLRATLERKACVNPHNLQAIGVAGWRHVYPKPQAPFAVVTCADHVTAENYQAFYRVTCTKKFPGWACGETSLWLRSDFLGRGPFQIQIEEGTLEAGRSALDCLQRGLEQHDVLDLRRRGVPSGLRLSRDPATQATFAETYLETSYECAWIHTPAHCEAGDVPVVVAAQGCVG